MVQVIRPTHGRSSSNSTRNWTGTTTRQIQTKLKQKTYVPACVAMVTGSCVFKIPDDRSWQRAPWKPNRTFPASASKALSNTGLHEYFTRLWHVWFLTAAHINKLGVPQKPDPVFTDRLSSMERPKKANKRRGTFICKRHMRLMRNTVAALDRSNKSEEVTREHSQLGG